MVLRGGCVCECVCVSMCVVGVCESCESVCMCVSMRGRTQMSHSVLSIG